MNLPRPRRLFLLYTGLCLTGAAFWAGLHTATQAEDQKSPAVASNPAGRTSISKRSGLRHGASATRFASQNPAIIFVQAPVVAEGGQPTRFPQGSHLARLALESQTDSPVNLTSDFFAAADPQISFDGAKVLFSALEKPGTRWQIWEMTTDGTSKRRVTNCQVDCLRPAYLAREHFVFTVIKQNAGLTTSEIHVAKLDGTEDHPITFGPGNYQVETVMKDGRILVSAASPLVPRGADSSALYALRHDGTGLQSLRCEHRQAAQRSEAAELADGSVVFVKTQGSKVGGELAMVRRGALHNSALSPLTAAAWSPRPLRDDQLIVARKAAVASRPAKFDLYAVDSATGRVGELIYRDTKLSSFQAVPVAAHTAPRWYWSTLNPEAKSGYFICLDAYHSVDERKGRISQPVAKVRVLILDQATGQERSLGEAPVETDGSFYVAVPPDRPVRFELLNARGGVIRAQQSWVWARPGEERGCVGCHEDKSVAPENRWPLTLRRFDTPTPLGSEVDVKVEH